LGPETMCRIACRLLFSICLAVYMREAGNDV